MGPRLVLVKDLVDSVLEDLSIDMRLSAERAERMSWTGPKKLSFPSFSIHGARAQTNIHWLAPGP